MVNPCRVVTATGRKGVYKRATLKEKLVVSSDVDAQTVPGYRLPPSRTLSRLPSWCYGNYHQIAGSPLKLSLDGSGSSRIHPTNKACWPFNGFLFIAFESWCHSIDGQSNISVRLSRSHRPPLPASWCWSLPPFKSSLHSSTHDHSNEKAKKFQIPFPH